MKAQSLRRTLWLSSGLLALGLAASVAWVALKVKPAQAQPTKDVGRWLDRQMKAYRSESIVPQTYYPVEPEDLEQIVQETSHGLAGKGLPKIGGKTKVGAYVGEVPPEPQREKPAEEVETGPKGLAEVGHPRVVIHVPGRRTSFLWEFPDKKKGEFEVGDLVPKDGKFRVVEVTPIVEEGMTKYRFVYEVVGQGGDAAAEPKRDEHVFELTPKRTGTGIQEVDVTGKPIVPAAPAAPAPGAAPTAPEQPQPAPVLAGVVSSERKGSLQNYWFEDRSAYERFSKDSIEKILETVKTETALDDAGRPRGIKITAPGLGNEFDVRAGDIVISVNGQPVHSRNDVIEVVKKLPKDAATVPVIIERNGRQLTYNVDPRDPEVRRAAGKLRFQK